MNNTAVICRIKNVRRHNNAERLQIANVLGNQVIVGLDNTEEQLGIYFDSNLQLSEEFATANNLIRIKNEDGTTSGGLFDERRKVKTQRLRGEISDGFWCELEYLQKCIEAQGLPFDAPEEGAEFDVYQGVAICNKYIPRTYRMPGAPNSKEKKKKYGSIMFKEHFDTDHFGKHVHHIPVGSQIHITQKIHGTSARIGHCQVEQDLTWFGKLLKYIGVPINQYQWEYMNGTRRVVLNPKNRGTGFHDDSIRDFVFEKLLNNLRKGETIYGEIVGYEPSGKPIMPEVDLTKTNDKDFIKRYSNAGKNKMVYKYKCEPNTCDFYVYRITMTNEDGQSVDYSWQDVMTRCNEIGVKHVPHIETIYYGPDEGVFTTDDLTAIVELHCDGPDLIDSSHLREGVCIRVEGGLYPKIYKHKNYHFKVLEELIKDAGIADMEEQESVSDTIDATENV